MRTRMKGDQRRASIVEEAIRLFAEKGFRGTTTRELAASLNVTEPVLYQHFKTKGELYTAIIETKARVGMAKSSELARHLEGGDDGVLLAYVATMILDHFAQDPSFSRLLLFSALEGHELAALFYEQHLVQFYNLVAAYFRRRMREGALREVDPQVAARSFIGMVSYHGQIQLLFGVKVKMTQKKLVNQLVTVFLDGMRVPGEKA